MKPEILRWAEALAIEKLHGEEAGAYLEARITDLVRAGDMAGVARMCALAEKLMLLKPAKAIWH